MESIIITVEGGVIQAIEGIPDNVEIHIKDYDADGSNPNDETEEDGTTFYHDIWTSKGCTK